MVSTIAETPSSNLTQSTAQPSTVYGPVESWRFGKSLGIDLLRDISTCSFNCIYCQLGDIQQKTNERRDYVSTADVLADLEQAPWQDVDIITLSGSGEPTLALNCGEVIRALKGLTGKPIMVLTNGTLLHLPEVRQDLMAADHVAVKLDAATEAGLRQMNRPVPGVTLESIIQGAMALREEFPGKLSIQSMFMPTNLKELEALAEIIARIQPDEVQLNTPKRPYPLEWFVESRGNHPASGNEVLIPSRTLKTVDPETADSIEAYLSQKTGIPVLSIYHR